MSSSRAKPVHEGSSYPQIKSTDDKFNQSEVSTETTEIGEMVFCYLNDLGLTNSSHVGLKFSDKVVTAFAERVVGEV